MSKADPRQVALIYQDTRKRITALVNALDDTGLQTSVVACPGWSVRDAVAHLAAVADDVGQGHLTGPPSDEETAAQIDQFDGQEMVDILANWTAAAARLYKLAENTGVEAQL